MYNDVDFRARAGRLLFAIALVLLGASGAGAGEGGQAAPACQASGPLARVADLPEASGIAASRRVPGRVWAHNDSGRPLVIALDARGAVAGRVQLTGATVEDWEAIAIGSCPAGSCLYVADIGDNDASRKRITIYRLPEPQAASGTAAVSDVWHGTYPDGAHDAEAVLVSGDGRIHIVTKGETGPVALYRFPTAARPGAVTTLERVGGTRPSRDEASRITDGSVSPDGAWVALRTLTAVTFYPAADFFAGRWNAAARVDVSGLKEPQGEGVALGPDNTVYLAGEGGGKGQPGTFARFPCTPAR